MYTYIIVQTDGQFSDREWVVKGVHNNIRAASVQAWKDSLEYHLSKTYLKDWWCKTSKYNGIGPDHHILVWDMARNIHIGTWYLEKNAPLKQIGEQGISTFETTIELWLSELKTNKVPKQLWINQMRFEDEKKYSP